MAKIDLNKIEQQYEKEISEFDLLAMLKYVLYKHNDRDILIDRDDLYIINKHTVLRMSRHLDIDAIKLKLGISNMDLIKDKSIAQGLKDLKYELRNFITNLLGTNKTKNVSNLDWRDL